MKAHVLMAAMALAGVGVGVGTGCERKKPAEPAKAPAPASRDLRAAPLAAAPVAAQALATAVAAAPTAAAPTAPSLYDLTLKLTDQNARVVGFDVFRGYPTVVSMFYGACPSACPLLVSDVKAIESALPPAVRANLRVLLVSFSPEKDTPKRLAAFAKKAGVDVARWRFAAPAPDAVRELAAVLGIQYQKLPDGSYNHSSIITLLDGRGRAAARIDGLARPNDELVGRVKELAAPLVR